MSSTRLSLSLAAALLAGYGSAYGASGTISANPNPCLLPPGARTCTTYLTWSTKDAQNVRVYVAAEGKVSTPEKEFSTKNSCERCGASWIEDGSKYIFKLVDFPNGSRGAVLATVTVTAGHGPEAAPRSAEGTGMIAASPNPCRIEPGKYDCATTLTWSTKGVQHARVYVQSEGKKPSEEKEFGTGKNGSGRAPWIEANTTYLFTLYDFSTGSKGAALAKVAVTATK